MRSTMREEDQQTGEEEGWETRFRSAPKGSCMAHREAAVRMLSLLQKEGAAHCICHWWCRTHTELQHADLCKQGGRGSATQTAVGEVFLSLLSLM